MRPSRLRYGKIVSLSFLVFAGLEPPERPVGIAVKIAVVTAFKAKKPFQISLPTHLNPPLVFRKFRVNSMTDLWRSGGESPSGGVIYFASASGAEE